MNLVYNHDKSRDEPKPCPLSAQICYHEYCYLISGLPKELLGMIEGLYLTKIFENLIPVPFFRDFFFSSKISIEN